MVRLFCNATGTGTLVRCLNLPTKRYMSNVRSSIKIRVTVPSVHNAHSLDFSQLIIMAF